MTAPVLGVIPVRAGSKRIPRKAMQLVQGKPLLQWTIDIARAATSIDRLVVSTESSELAAYARLRGVEVVDRPAHLAHDDSTIAEVVRHAVADLEWEGTVVVLQPTCPLLKPETVDRVVGEFQGSSFDWGITATPVNHIHWKGSRPLTPRVNSQFLANDPAPLWRESGAVQVMSGRYARAMPSNQAVAATTVIPIDPAEALDIDTFADLAAARQALGRRTILFHVVASDEKGSGHLRRCLQLSDALAHHDVWWMPNGLESWARQIADDHGIRFAEAPDAPDLAIIDCLEAAEKLAPRYAVQGTSTVVFEPELSGPSFLPGWANMIIDEFAFPQCAILRPEFLCLPAYEVRERAENVLVTFGGTDPAEMNERVRKLVRHGTDTCVVVMRPGENRMSMAEAMSWADLVITSQGRTVHEAAAVGVPCLSIAVNERESRHARLDGVVYLGLAHTVSDAAILDTVNRLLMSAALRREMSATSSKQIDGKGLGRVVRKIEDLLA